MAAVTLRQVFADGAFWQLPSKCEASTSRFQRREKMDGRKMKKRGNKHNICRNRDESVTATMSLILVKITLPPLLCRTLRDEGKAVREFSRADLNLAFKLAIVEHDRDY